MTEEQNKSKSAHWRKTSEWPKKKDYPIILIISEIGEEPSHWIPIAETKEVINKSPQ